MTKLEELQNKLTELKAKARASRLSNEVKSILATAKALEQEIKVEKIKIRLEHVNKAEADKRAFLKAVYEINWPDANIVTNEGRFHATRVQKYPDIVKLLNDYAFVSVTGYNGKDGPQEISVGRYGRFYTLRRNYEVTGEVRHVKFESFEKMLDYNWVKAKPMTLTSVLSKIRRIENEGKKIDKALSNYREKVKELDALFLEKENFLTRHNAPSVYQYLS